MDHPLRDDLTKYSSEEIDRKYTDLIGRFDTAKRMGMDRSILYQLDLLLNGIEDERYRRMEEALNKIDDDPVVVDTDREPKSSKSPTIQKSKNDPTKR